jgi:hypothetical protein
MLKKILQSSILLITLVSFNSLKPVKVITGNATDSAQSFTFKVKLHSFKKINNANFFIAADEQIANNEFAIAATTNYRGRDSFISLAPKTVTLDGTENQTNPLNGQEFSLMSTLVALAHPIFSGYPVVVIKNDTSKIYAVINYQYDTASGGFKFFVDVISSEKLTDSGTLAYTVALETFMNSVIAAIKPTLSGNFGEAGSGISTLQVTDKKIKFVKFTAFDTANADSLKLNSADTITFTPSQQPNLKMLGKKFSRLYIPVQIIGGANGGYGIALSKSVGTLKQIANPGAIGSNSIIASSTAGAQISFYNLDCMHTSTDLVYMIANGGVGIGNVKNKIYALPLVSKSSNDDEIGMIANKNQTPEVIEDTKSEYESFFKSRDFTQPASSMVDMVTPTDPAAVVGRGDAPGDVQELIVINDAVFISVTNTITPVANGIYNSQAIFDEYGRLAGWTNWKRAGSADNATSLVGFAVDETLVNFWSIPADTQKKVLKTIWDTGTSSDTALSKVTQTIFNNSRITNVKAYPNSQPGLDNVSLVIASGNQKIAIIQTSNSNGPITNFNSVFQSTDGTTSGISNTGYQILNISGGELNNLNLITSTTLLWDNNNSRGWLAVSSDKGLAILANPDGSGWSGKIDSGFVNFSSNNNLKFIKIGNYQKIKKLAAINDQLFVFTQTTLERIDMQNPFSTPIILFQGNPLDGIITQSTSIMANMQGLFQTSKNLSTATSISDAQWTSVEVPNSNDKSKGVINKFTYMIGSEDDFINNNVINFYLLDSSESNSPTFLYRYTKNKTTDAITLFPDFRKHGLGYKDRQYICGLKNTNKNQKSFRKYIETNGATYLFTGSAFNQYLASIDNLVSPLKIAQDCLFGSMLQFNNANFIGPVILDTGSGSFITYGDFGLSING